MCASAWTSIKETDGTEKRAWEMKIGLQLFISKMLHALMPHPPKKWDRHFAQKSNIYFYGTPLQDGTFLRLSKAVTFPSMWCAAVWCIVFFPIVLHVLSCPTSQHLSDPYAPSYLSHLCSLLKLGDLSPTSMSLWSFIQIAKEKFSMPLRDNYQTLKHPHSSRWVITFPPHLSSSSFFLKWNHQFLKPWQSTIPRRCRPSDFWMKTARSKCCPLCLRLKVFPPLAHFVFLLFLSFPLSFSPSSLAWSHIHTNNSPDHLHSGQLHSICKPALNFSRIRFC